MRDGTQQTGFQHSVPKIQVGLAKDTGGNERRCFALDLTLHWLKKSCIWPRGHFLHVRTFAWTVCTITLSQKFIPSDMFDLCTGLTELISRRNASFPKFLVLGGAEPCYLERLGIFQNVAYNLWKTGCFSCQILILLPDGCVGSSLINALGSWQDSRIAGDYYDELISLLEGYRLVTD